MARRYKPPEGWTLQAFSYELEEPPPEMKVRLNWFFGARRFAHNWAVSVMRKDIDEYHQTGVSTTEPPSLPRLRKRWNVDKHDIAVDKQTGQPWWTEISKYVFDDGISAAVNGHWNWQQSRAKKRAGPRVRPPKMHKKGKKSESFTICQADRTSTGIRLIDNRCLRIPKLGEVRTHESMRKIGRLIERGMGRILAVTVKRSGGRVIAVLRVEVIRPQRHHKPSQPHSRVGVDVGQRTLAVVADENGTILERVPNPEPLKQSLSEVRRLNRKLSRQKRGSNRYNQTKKSLAKVYRHIANQRKDCLHKLTTRLTKNHGVVVIEDLNVAGMRRGGAKHLRDANLGGFKRMMSYKGGWYGCDVVLADRWFASSKTCSRCGHVQQIGSAKHWTCGMCDTFHDRDENAAVNLARWRPKTGEVTSRRVPDVRSREGRKSRTGTRPALVGSRTAAQMNSARSDGESSTKLH